MSNITVQNIADKLALSRNTVSKVLNGKSGVLPQTHDLIIQTAKDMGYYKFKPNVINEVTHIGEGYKDEFDEPIIDNFSSQNHKIILLLTTKGKFNLFWSSIASGVYEELSRSSYSLVYAEASVSPDGVAELPSILSQGIIDGIVVINIYEQALLKAISQAGLPTVYFDNVIGNDPPDVNGDILISDGISATKEMTMHMLERGSKNLCFIGDISVAISMHDRFVGFSAAHKQLNKEIHPAFALIEDESAYYRKKNVEDAINNLPFIPDGFVCGSDHIAHTVMQCLKTKNYKLPQDIKICGFDDIVTSSIVRPYLTSAKTSNDLLGKRIAQQILSRIDDQSKPFELVRLYPKVKFRESTEYNT